MDKPKELPRKPADKRSPPINSNLVWYLLALGVVVLLLVVYVQQERAYEISYSDLLKLLRETPSTPRIRPINNRLLRFSAPADIRIGPQEITGKANRQALDLPDAETPRAAHPSDAGQPAAAVHRGRSRSV